MKITVGFTKLRRWDIFGKDDFHIENKGMLYRDFYSLSQYWYSIKLQFLRIWIYSYSITEIPVL